MNFPLRRFLATQAGQRTSLKIGLLPADGIGREVIPVYLDLAWRVLYLIHSLGC
jgi:hypothetical protein